MTPIILMSGSAGSGKDSGALMLAREFNAVCVGQADPIKRIVQMFFGFSHESLYGYSELRVKPLEHFTDLSEDDLDNVCVEWQRITGDGSLVELKSWYRRYRPLAQDGTLTPRQALQGLGTDLAREINKDLWPNIAKHTARTLLSSGHKYDRVNGLSKEPGNGYDWIVITDGRFRNEVISISRDGGIPILIKRAVKKLGDDRFSHHASEREIREIPKHYFRYVVNNDGTEEEFLEKLRRIMSLVMNHTRTF